ncbi:double-strand break repair helicase AddA [Sphingomonas sp. LY54]|uniref:double-strand break repair helicase AddA n=1 Tax=Sphingomonas sp. LY54 TaxID=3095343 RepID=UPI002D79F16B|nr:double-strand break repair helicase AddA [Sphingomonas sp. LY54]WRP28954.1 double-strand break repair helicase AddA [Sphingomonas sp. LY54]
MPKRLKPLSRLQGDQLRASSPRDHAALSASAGTGKTHVLTARVLRLLLSGVDPASILCLTFTKAGAAEMADRIHARLAYWVRLKDAELGAELVALGEDPGPASRERARTLFARVLDAAGGGLRIQTIHAFAQGLLAAFPAEAGLVPGFRPLEAREEKALARQTLADLLVRAEAGGDLPLVRDLQALSHRLGEGGAEDFLMQCARAPAAMEALGAREGIEARLRRAFGIPAGDVEEAIAEACCDDIFDVGTVDRIVAANRDWGTASGLKCCDAIAAWRTRSNAERGLTLDELAGTVLTKAGEPRAVTAGLLKAAPDYAQHAAKLVECCQALLRLRSTARLVEQIAAGLRVGQSFAAAYAAAKRAQGAVDFDDLIRWAERLLLEPGMGEWVRFKLDQQTDHILVDEAQDTNERQWNIVRALALEYFAGEGARDAHRTIFTVGDYKQAIFGFQGTDPQSFDVARAWFDREARAVERDFLDLSMDRSFRSSPPILQAVDRVIADLGHEALGLPKRPNPHESFHETRPGSVTLWQPLSVELAETLDEDKGEEGWIGDSVRLFASRVARQIRHWLDHPFEIGHGDKKRPVRPEDILILVRRRSTLAALIVARLHAEGVPVAGVDRLLLSAPLAVQDLLAAARFAVQPMDDLNLAGLLVSPLFGWTQDQLFAVAHKREGALWPEIRAKADPATLEGLQDILAMADYATPHQFIETLLSGPLEGRRRLLERLGPEARDPIEELLASALDFESNARPSLQRFLDWFARGDVEIVRDAGESRDAVRVMTAHGSKGLQSPVVILADATVDPSRSRAGGADLDLGDGSPPLPVFRPRKDELTDPLKAQVERQDALDRQEHWRLLYVAMTRAEERLYVGGALGPADRRGPPQGSWYQAIETSLAGLGCDWQEDRLWGQARRFGDAEAPARGVTAKADRAPLVAPHWAHRPAPIEARPPRPLAPSSLGEDDVPNPPPTPAMRAASERGKLLHALFERLPSAAPDARAALADAWLEHSAGVADAALRSRLVADACAIIGDPAFADIFGPDALAEAPIAAVTPEGAVITGTVDRLLVTDAGIRLVDFKTGRGVPARPEEVPVPHLRQMAAYVAALEVIFPGRPVEASLLYTSGPTLHPLPRELLLRFGAVPALAEG